MQLLAKEIVLKGSPICRGIAIGKAFILNHDQFQISESSITKSQVASEIKRYQSALINTRNDLKYMQKQLESEGATEAALILEAQYEMLHDPLLTTELENAIATRLKNAESILQQKVLKFKEKFESFDDPFFEERYKDLQDLSQLILNYLNDNISFSLSNLPAHTIICAKELTTTDVAGANPSFIGAFITEGGGSTSHAAIVAKAKGIPFITNVNLAPLLSNFDSPIIVDGRLGKVILNPAEETLKLYELLTVQINQQMQEFEKISKWPAHTYDGHAVNLMANLEMNHEIDLVHRWGGLGVGLFRSEYIFLPKNEIPGEEEQYQIYLKLIKNLKGLPITIRTFDLGGDKALDPDLDYTKKSPQAAPRNTRSLLKDEMIFKTQIRAILRAGMHGQVSILFPMISTLTELKEAKRMVQEVKQELKISKHVPLGCMIEVPSAALIADQFAKECDFLSIGTNDLMQYSLAIDRRDHMHSEFYEPSDPSVIRLLHFITTQANLAGIPVSVCGEVAADPRFTPLLLGLGVQQLSVSPRYLPIIKNAIRSTSIVEAIHLAEKVLSLSSGYEVMQLLRHEYQKNVPHDLFYNSLEA